jgi:3D (Asp-Asp-Asp) domain-containing protein
MYFASIVLWLIVVLYCLVVPVRSTEQEVIEDKLPGYDIHAEAQEPVTFEDWFRANANVIEDCEITHYCCEQREHICGTGDGITATGVPVTPGWTCAVDPSVIPYGCEVMVDFGDHVEFYKAQDCGGAIKGNHIDLAVESHDLAIELGTLTATVYFMEVETEF